MSKKLIHSESCRDSTYNLQTFVDNCFGYSNTKDLSKINIEFVEDTSTCYYEGDIPELKLNIYEDVDSVMYVLRGISGSGKSTLGRKIAEWAKENGGTSTICSADNYFMVKGQYVFDREKLWQAHSHCRGRVFFDINQGFNCVIVDNTNTTWKECKEYVKIAVDNGCEVVFVEPDTPWKEDVAECVKRNTHNVPKESIQNMLDRFQPAGAILAEAEKIGCKAYYKFGEFFKG